MTKYILIFSLFCLSTALSASENPTVNKRIVRQKSRTKSSTRHFQRQTCPPASRLAVAFNSRNECMAQKLLEADPLLIHGKTRQGKPVTAYAKTEKMKALVAEAQKHALEHLIATTQAALTIEEENQEMHQDEGL